MDLAGILPTCCKATLPSSPSPTVRCAQGKSRLQGCPQCVSHPHTLHPVSPGHSCKPTHLLEHLLASSLADLFCSSCLDGLAYCTVVYHHYLGNEAASSLLSKLLSKILARYVALSSSQSNQQSDMSGPKRSLGSCGPNSASATQLCTHVTGQFTFGR